MSEKNKVDEISKKLWAMANELRGNMDAGEFKNYILAFMFYRYLSIHQENYLEINNLLEMDEQQNINDAYRKQAIGKDLAEYLGDISSTLGYAISPEYTWKSLIDKIENSEVIPSDYQDMFESFSKNAELNKEASKDFSGVFNDVNLGDSRLGVSTNARSKSLNNIVKMVEDIEYKDESGRDVLGEIYEYLIGQFAASAGKKGGEFYTPHQVSKILAKIVTSESEDTSDNFTLYDPTMGSGSLLLTVRQELVKRNMKRTVKFYGQELGMTTYNLARMNLMMHDVSYNNMTLSNADTLESDWPDGVNVMGVDAPRHFDAVVANPPYSAKWNNEETKLKDPRFGPYGKLAPASKADYAFILHSLYHLNETGTMAIVLPHGVLFRGAAEGTIRTALIKNNFLHAVIGLPSNLFYGTSIPTCILVFKKNRKTKEILFIDASNDFEKKKNQNVLLDEHIDKIIQAYINRKSVDKYSHIAQLEEMEENDFNLNIPRYVDTFEEEEILDLNEINRLLKEDDEEIERLEKEISEMLKLLGVE